MKNLLLVALIIQLLITNIESNGDGNGTEGKGKLEFGDIISFPRTCGGKTVYEHKGIFVGKSTDEVDVGQGDNDLFHLTAKKGLISQAQFAKIAEVRGAGGMEHKDNFLDGRADFKKGDPATMKARILDCHGDTQLYGPLNKNCEHLSTFVRYGKKISEQQGTLVEPVMKLNEDVKARLAKVEQDWIIEQNCPF